MPVINIENEPATSTSEHCQRCRAAISSAETAHVWENQIICGACAKLLSGVPGELTTGELIASILLGIGAFFCFVCGFQVAASADRFHDDNAYGAAANALESLQHLIAGSTCFLIAVLLCIFAILIRINARLRR